MKKSLGVFRFELISALRRPSYIFFAFGLPVLAVIGFAGYSFFRSNLDLETIEGQIPEEFRLETEGFVDHAGLINVIPNDLPANLLVEFPNEDEAQIALNRREINSYYIIPGDYLETGEMYYIHPNINPIAGGGQDWVMRWTLIVNLLGGDINLASHFWNPAEFKEANLSIDSEEIRSSSGECSTPGFSCESNVVLQLLPLGIMAIIYVSILAGGSYLLRLISSEKDSRIMEILLLSASPRELLIGKIAAYCLLGFFQVLIWLGSAFAILNIGGTSLNIPAGFVFPVTLIVWGLVFFLAGFAIYASLMAGAGALTPKLSQYTSVYFIISAPLLITYVLSLILARIPHSTLAVVLSIFPLSAPVMMITRMTVGGVPSWQPIAAAALAFFTAIFIIRAVSRMFHAQLLLSGQPFSLTRYLKVLFRR